MLGLDLPEMQEAKAHPQDGNDAWSQLLCLARKDTGAADLGGLVEDPYAYAEQITTTRSLPGWIKLLDEAGSKVLYQVSSRLHAQFAKSCVSIPLGHWLRFWLAPCVLCGSSIPSRKHSRIGRIDLGADWSPGNLVTCCNTCSNTLRKDDTHGSLTIPLLAAHAAAISVQCYPSSCHLSSAGASSEKYARLRSNNSLPKSSFQFQLRASVMVRFTSIMSQACAEQKQFCLDDELCEQVFRTPCAYCGIEPVTKKQLYNRLMLTDPSDTKYDMHNVVACCDICYAMRGTMTQSAFLQHCRKIGKRWAMIQ
jgi:hypothetical protein